MKLHCRLLPLFALVVAAGPLARAIPDAEATAGRLTLRNLADAVVGVRLTIVLKVSVNGRDLPPREIPVDVNGTVMTGDGLTVTSLAAVDPKSAYDVVRIQMQTTGMPADLLSSEMKSIRIRLADGTEVPARLIGKDAARDIAFFGPENPSRSFTFVDFRRAAESATAMADCLHLMRLTDAMGRIAVVRPGVIVAITERPRRMILTSTDLYQDGVGCPVFDGEGRLIGVCLRYLDKDLARGPVVVPAAEILEQANAL